MGRCSSFMRILPATSAWILLLSSTAIYFAFPCRYLMSVYTIGIPLFQAVITFFVVVNFALATFINPGIIPKATTDEIKNDAGLAAYRDIEIAGVKVRQKWCVTCQFYRPPRCVHCGVCDNCIETFDHHCPWVNNCIGRRNYRYFFMFLLWLSIHMISIFSLCGLYMKDHVRNFKELPTIMTLVIISVIIILFLPVLGLTIFHMMLLIQGKTTNEQVTGKFMTLKNPYNRGCCRNVMYSLCNSPLPRFRMEKSLSNEIVQLRQEYTRSRSHSKENLSPAKAMSMHLNYIDSSDYILPKQSLSADDLDETPPSYLNRTRLHLSLSESIYTRSENSNHRGRSSRALTPPVPIRFDCSRRSLPPHNRMHAPSPHYAVAQSVNVPVPVHGSGSSTHYYNGPSKYGYASSLGDVCGSSRDEFCQQKSVNYGLPGNAVATMSSDSCCLGNPTVDKLQEIANRSLIGGQCKELSVLEGCVHTTNTARPLVSTTGQAALFPSNCVDCQPNSASSHSYQSSISSNEFVRTPGNRPLSFVRAMEMSEPLQFGDYLLDGNCQPLQLRTDGAAAQATYVRADNAGQGMYVRADAAGQGMYVRADAAGQVTYVRADGPGQVTYVRADGPGQASYQPAGSQPVTRTSGKKGDLEVSYEISV